MVVPFTAEQIAGGAEDPCSKASAAYSVGDVAQQNAAHRGHASSVSCKQGPALKGVGKDTRRGNPSWVRGQPETIVWNTLGFLLSSFLDASLNV